MDAVTQRGTRNGALGVDKAFERDSEWARRSQLTKLFKKAQRLVSVAGHQPLFLRPRKVVVAQVDLRHRTLQLVSEW